jgi:hypothetical protein
MLSRRVPGGTVTIIWPLTLTETGIVVAFDTPSGGITAAIERGVDETVVAITVPLPVHPAAASATHTASVRAFIPVPLPLMPSAKGTQHSAGLIINQHAHEVHNDRSVGMQWVLATRVDHDPGVGRRI